MPVPMKDLGEILNLLRESKEINRQILNQMKETREGTKSMINTCQDLITEPIPEELDSKNKDDEPSTKQLEDEMEAITNEGKDLCDEEDNRLKNLNEHRDQAAFVKSYNGKSDDNIDRAYSEPRVIKTSRKLTISSSTQIPCDEINSSEIKINDIKIPPKATADSSKNPPRKASSSKSKASVSSKKSEPTCPRYARNTTSTTAKITPRHAIPTTPSRTTSRPPSRRESVSSSNSGREQQVSHSDISLPSVTPIKRPQRKQWEHLKRSTMASEESINSYYPDHEPSSKNIQTAPSISQIPDRLTDLEYPSVDFSNTKGTQIEINGFPDVAHLQILNSIGESKCEASRELNKIPDEQHTEILASKKTYSYSDDTDIATASVQLFVCEEALEAATDSDILPDSNNNNNNNNSYTEIASSFPQICSSDNFQYNFLYVKRKRELLQEEDEYIQGYIKEE